MPKYIRRTRTTSTDSTDALRDMLLRELEKEGQKLLRQMTAQFTRDLEQQGTHMLQGLFSPGKTGGSGTSIPGLDSITQLVGSLVSYAVSKPKTTSSTAESARSKRAESQFRLSHSQAMLEASSELSRSERNL